MYICFCCCCFFFFIFSCFYFILFCFHLFSFCFWLWFFFYSFPSSGQFQRKTKCRLSWISEWSIQWFWCKSKRHPAKCKYFFQDWVICVIKDTFYWSSHVWPFVVHLVIIKAFIRRFPWKLIKSPYNIENYKRIKTWSSFDNEYIEWQNLRIHHLKVHEGWLHY